MKKSFLLSIHSVAGLVAGVFILLLSVSGTILVFHDEVDGLQKPAVETNGKAPVTIDSCYRVIQQHYPNAEISSCQLPGNTGGPYSFFIYDSSFNSGKAVQELFIQPYTGQIIGSRGGSDDMKHNFTGWLSKFHNSFHAGKKGEWLLGLIAVIFVLSIFTGIILYRKSIIAVIFFRKAVFKKANLHQLVGVYALLFNLMIGITGFWMQRYVFKKEFYADSSWVKTSRKSPALFFNYDSAYQDIHKQHPGFTGYVIYFAQSAKSKTAIYGSNNTNAFIHSKKFADVIALDSTGKIASTRFVDENTAGDYYDIVNSQLHMGKYGGWFIKLLYGLFGITSSILSITGFWLWLNKKRRDI
jgi:uncharacterized iron-regulated membrane protein